MTPVSPDTTIARSRSADALVDPDVGADVGAGAATSVPAGSPPAPRGPGRSGDMSMGELLHKVNAFFYNKHTGLVLILAMAFLALMGALLQQAPEVVRDDPQSYAQWLDSVRPRYGGWTNVLSALGFFSMFSSIWFIAVTILLAISIVCCTTHRLPQLWQRATHPHLHVTDGFFEHATIGQDFDVDTDRGTALVTAADSLRAARYRVVPDDKDPDGSFYADKFRWAPFGTAVAHAAFVILLLGVFVTATFGFRNNSFAVPVGSTADVGHDTGLRVRVNAFDDAYYADGRPSDYVSDLTLFDNGQQVAQQEIRVNTPLRYDGVSFYQSYFGIAASMRITDGEGKVLFAGGVPLQYQTESQANVFGRQDLPEQNLTVFVIGAASGRTDGPVAAGQMQVDVFPMDGENLINSRIIDQGSPAQVGGLDVTFERERQFTGLMVSRDPGAIIIWIGSALLVIGTSITMGLKHRRLWVRVTTGDSAAGGAPVSRVRLASADRRDVMFARQVNTLASRIRTTSAATHQSASDSPAAGSASTR